MAKSAAAKRDVTLADNEQGQPAGDKVTVALDAHLELVSWLGTFGATQEFISFAWAYSKPEDSEDFTRQRAEFWHEVAQGYLSSAPTFYVTGEMGRVTAAAAADLEPCPVLLPQDLPSPSGFVYFASAPRFSDYAAREGMEGTWGMRPRIRAVSWQYENADATGVPRMGRQTGVHGISYFFWTYVPDLYDDIERALAGDDAMFQQPVTVEGLNSIKEYLGTTKWLPFELSAWAFGASYEITDKPVEQRLDNTNALTEGLKVYVEIEWQRRFLLALWSLMQQEIVVVEHGKLDRAAWRRLKRQQEKMPDFGDVKIVRLRRGYNPVLEMVTEDTEISHHGEIEWTHRWPVRGHWRNQPYGPNRALRKRIWIPPFVKGPQDKPLVIKDTIYSLER